MASSTYLVALGSNRRGRHGSPEAEIAAALTAVGGVRRVAPVLHSAPVGPARRRFANTVALVATEESPPVLLARLKRIEAAFGRRRARRWSDRVIDLDLILWSGGAWVSPGLVVPHPRWRERRFVLAPLARLAPTWRDPLTGLAPRHLLARLTAPRPLPRSAVAW